MAFDFGLLSAGLGLLRGINQDSAARSQMNAANRLTNDSIKTASDAYYEFKKQLQDAKARGAYNADEILRLADERAQLNLENSLKNSSAQMSLLGYKPGDSNVERTFRKTSADANLAQREQRAAIGQTFSDRLMNAEQSVANAGFGLSGIQRGAASQLYGMGQSNAANSGLGDAMGLISDYLTPKQQAQPAGFNFSEAWKSQHPVLRA